MIGGGFGKVVERSGRCNKIVSVLVGLSRSEFELSQVWSDTMLTFWAISRYISDKSVGRKSEMIYKEIP